MLNIEKRELKVLSPASLIVVLNGPSSAGKTTLARAVRDRVGATCAALSIDQFFPFVHRDAPNNWHTFSALTEAMFAATAAFATAGFDVIVDTVFERPESLTSARRALAAHQHHLVGVTCSLDILEERERARADRRIGQARAQFERVMQNASYDLLLDTGKLSVEGCADQIIALMGKHAAGDDDGSVDVQ
jgi:chloramphenicol 3-O phosphotransferase